MSPQNTGRLTRWFVGDAQALKKEIENPRISGQAQLVFGIILMLPSLLLIIGLVLEEFILTKPSANNNSVMYFIYSQNIIMAGISIILGLRNKIVEKRLATSIKEVEAELEAETNKLKAETQNQLPPMNAQDEIAHINDAETQKELHELNNTELETKQLNQTES